MEMHASTLCHVLIMLICDDGTRMVIFRFADRHSGEIANVIVNCRCDPNYAACAAAQIHVPATRCRCGMYPMIHP